MESLWDQQNIERIKNVDKVRSAPERIIPGYTCADAMAEHMARYQWAAPRLRGRVLDLGCGVGYGGQLLLSANSAIKEVIGVDVSPAALEYANRTYAREYLQFVQADACRLPFLEGSFDAVVSFEAIEHVADPEQCFQEVRRVLKPGGTFVVSTPNKLVTSPLLPCRPFNPHHLREWYPPKFLSFVDRYFTITDLYGQNWFSRSILLYVFLRNLKTLIKVALHKMRVFYVLRGVYRSLHPFTAPPEGLSAVDATSQFIPRQYTENSSLIPGILIVVTARP